VWVARVEAYNRLKMKLVNRLKARRRRKAHERYLQERERQRLLSELDTEKTIRDVATNWNAAGQGTSGTGPAP
jgi:hypothetical protein